MTVIGGIPGDVVAPVQVVPTQADTKAVIVAWLLAHGASFTEAALMNLSKDELLNLVADLLDNP
jgi:hypothetical protein